MFSQYFTSYSNTEPPPIIPDDYIQQAQLIPEKEYDLNKYSYNFLEKLNNEKLLDNIPPSDKSFFTPNFGTPILHNDTKPSIAKSVVDVAKSFLGSQYVYGSMNPEVGFDCSGLIKYAYEQNGISLPRTVSQIQKMGKEIKSLNDIKIGDLICTNGSGPSGKHIKMVSKIKDGQIYTIEAKGKKYGIIEEPLNSDIKINTIRRIITEYPKLDTHKDYVNTMYQYLYQALENNGVDGKTWAPILVAHTSIESNWGNQFSKEHNNFGGIKGSNGVPVYTTEYNSNKGYYKTKDTFKKYNSIEDFSNDFVKKLKYQFHAFDGTPEEYAYNLKNNNYFTEQLSVYQNSLNSRLRRINNILNS